MYAFPEDGENNYVVIKQLISYQNYVITTIIAMFTKCSQWVAHLNLKSELNFMKNK